MVDDLTKDVSIMSKGAPPQKSKLRARQQPQGSSTTTSESSTNEPEIAFECTYGLDHMSRKSFLTHMSAAMVAIYIHNLIAPISASVTEGSGFSAGPSSDGFYLYGLYKRIQRSGREISRRTIGRVIKDGLWPTIREEGWQSLTLEASLEGTAYLTLTLRKSPPPSEEANGMQKIDLSKVFGDGQ